MWAFLFLYHATNCTFPFASGKGLNNWLRAFSFLVPYHQLDVVGLMGREDLRIGKNYFLFPVVGPAYLLQCWYNVKQCRLPGNTCVVPGTQPSMCSAIYLHPLPNQAPFTQSTKLHCYCQHLNGFLTHPKLLSCLSPMNKCHAQQCSMFKYFSIINKTYNRGIQHL